VAIFSGLSKEKAFLIKERSLEFPGIIVQLSYKRYYPYADKGAHILGYLGQINTGLITKLKEYGYNLNDVSVLPE
jgi:penicillin-binding protein 2